MFWEFLGDYVSLAEQADPGDLIWGGNEYVVGQLVEVEGKSKRIRGREDRDGLQLIVVDAEFVLFG